MPENSKSLRVLLVRLGAMGDILHSLPAVTALRRAHPEWTLGWAVEPQWSELFCAAHATPGTAGMPLVDALHMVPAKRWAKAWMRRSTREEVMAVRRELRAQHYDVAVDLQGAVRSALLARSAGTPRLIGEAVPREPAAKWLFKEKVPTRGVHVIEQSIEVVNAIAGDHLDFTLPLLPTDTESEAFAATLPQPFVLLSPGAGWGAKRWPAARYGAVARALAAQGFHVCINSGPMEMALAEEIVQSSGGVVHTLTPSLSKLMAITRRAALVIAGDTGPLHLACALGRPTVGIFGPTDPARNGPFGNDFRVLRHPESKRDHTRRAEPEAGLLTITPEAVTAAALDLLAAPQTSALRGNA
ncbi:MULTISPECIES: glycosyltransferase family 9 protein [Acidobacterium]|uniref:glycosyltransferase family 9 protein n=1 Tax=Acidobacterium TaxID=33973 RepID=UPI0002E2A709|nr:MULTISPECIES: glycosyltransferase family 9 protein [Acidobacterium]